MHSQQTVVFARVATKCSYWNKCSVCISLLLPCNSTLPTAVVWNVDNLLHNLRLYYVSTVGTMYYLLFLLDAGLLLT
jgi:hypothetical protein